MVTKSSYKSYCKQDNKKIHSLVIYSEHISDDSNKFKEYPCGYSKAITIYYTPSGFIHYGFFITFLLWAKAYSEYYY